MGSKNRTSKYILPIILKERKLNQCWVEPFVGGGNMIDKVEGKRIGSDINPYLIDALITIRDKIDKIPKNNQEFSENDYKKLKENDEYEFKGYAGFAFSYSGKWLGGWCRDKTGKRDYVRESYENACKQSPLLKSVELINSDYLNLSIPDNSLIYCDPPYRNTTKYKDAFNHDIFWDWCRKKANQGHVIFVSEYDAPSDFECVWQKEGASSLTQHTGSKKAVEKLFKLKTEVNFF